ncbi:MAG: redoxin domain-containing protein [Chloroflexi bacterium]|nr:redoxin domain-containing protein [Chloroflexota bacterium]
MSILDMKKLAPIMGLALVLLLAAGCQDEGYAASSTGSSSEVAPRVGKTAPDFTLTSLSGETVSLSSLRGKAVLINFWASWCDPCRAEMPGMEKVWKELKDQGMVILAINEREDKETAGKFVKELGLTFPILLDPGEVVFNTYRVTLFPSSFFIDREGVIRYMTVGQMSESTVRSRIKVAMGS